MDFPGLWTAESKQTAVAKRPPVIPHFEAVGITCKPKKAEGSPESRKAFWGEEEQRNE